jgi:asparagine synthase (glutamine-hydrolysing)
MCGLSGFVDFTKESNIEILNKMVATLGHRGPDDSGGELYDSEYANVGFGHNRLSIIDLSKAGHQPMNFGKYSILLNGEIYNYSEIKNDLIVLGHKFVSETDTEVVLHAFAEWGENSVKKFIGMFAFVILDSNLNELTIIRDRAGVKPLYYYWENDLFLFASELKAFHKHPSFIKKINKSAVFQYFDLGFVPSPNCIFENSKKLNPGHILKLDFKTKSIELKKYWDVVDAYRLPKLNVSYDKALDEVEKLLQSACEYRMVADVPVGVFLSGGYDSSLVTAMLQKNRKDKLKTFTIGFADGTDEIPFAKEIAKYIGTDHTDYYCTTKEAQDIITTLPFYYDEPFADSSAIPTILVSKLARKDVTVALSADGGDEIFAGYTYYNTYLNNIETLSKLPKFLFKVSGKILSFLSLFIINFNLKRKLIAISDVLQSDKDKLAQNLQKNYFLIEKTQVNKLLNLKRKDQKLIFDDDFSKCNDNLSAALAIDYSFYMQNDILTKVDRATMAVALEGREPFLDHRIIEYVAQLPSDFKIKDTQKRILKDILHRYIPKTLMDRPKNGFVIPIDSWLKKDLAFLLDENLSERCLSETGLFNNEYVKRLRRDFDQNKLNNSTMIWKLLQFQLWYKEWMI